jgi:tetratricopeptide (TPR) repeat protein
LTAAGCSLTGPHARGERALRSGNYPAAVAAFTEAIDADDHVVIAYANRCYAYGAQDLALEAVNDCDRAIELLEAGSDGELTPEERDIQHSEILNNRGVAQITLRKYPAALDDFTAAIELRPEYAEAYGNRGRTHIELENLDAAKTDLEQCITLAPETWSCHGNLAVVLAGQGDLPGALAAYQVAIEQGGDSEARFNRANLLYSIGCFSDAHADYEAVAADDDTDDYTQFMAQQQRDFLGNWEGEPEDQPDVCPGSGKTPASAGDASPTATGGAATAAP